MDLYERIGAQDGKEGESSPSLVPIHMFAITHDQDAMGIIMIMEGDKASSSE